MKMKNVGGVPGPDGRRVVRMDVNQELKLLSKCNKKGVERGWRCWVWSGGGSRVRVGVVWSM